MYVDRKHAFESVFSGKKKIPSCIRRAVCGFSLVRSSVPTKQVMVYSRVVYKFNFTLKNLYEYLRISCVFLY